MVLGKKHRDSQHTDGLMFIFILKIRGKVCQEMKRLDNGLAATVSLQTQNFSTFVSLLAVAHNVLPAVL